MNTTESLDGTGKSPDLSSATGETAIPGDTLITENKRRRLVRGAVALAPLVLTLRSGALAAASCTGTKIRDANVGTGNQKNIKNLSNSPITSGLKGVNDYPNNPDYCFPEVNSCTDPVLAAEGKVNTEISASAQVYRVGSSSGTRYRCGSADPDGALYQGQKIAILSSASASSMMAP